MNQFKQIALILGPALPIVALMVAGALTFDSSLMTEGLVPSIALCLFGVVLVKISVAGNRRVLIARREQPVKG